MWTFFFVHILIVRVIKGYSEGCGALDRYLHNLQI